MDTPTDNSSSERDPHGRFKVGCAPGPGRPRGCRDAVYLRRFRQQITPDDLCEVAVVVKRLALQGSLKAAELLMRYCLPMPQSRVHIEADLWAPTPDSASEFRVAGASPSQVDREMMQHIARLVRDQAAYEEQLRLAGYDLGPNFADRERV